MNYQQYRLTFPEIYSIF